MERKSVSRLLPEQSGGNPNAVTYSFSDWMDLLSEQYGTRWTQYRESFAKTNLASSALSASQELPSPLTITLELVNRCNLKCVMCWTDNHSLKKGVLGLKEIERMLSEFHETGHQLPAIIVGLGSEPLLYKEVKDVITLCKKYGVMDIFFGTNGVLLDEEMSMFLIEQDVTRLEISLDAATKETYLAIRSKDKFEIVQSNIRKFIELRNSLGKKTPVVRLAFVVQDLNVSERKLFLQQWSGLADYVDFQQMSDFSTVTQRLGKSLDYYLFEDESDQEKLDSTQKLKEKLEASNGITGSELFCPYPFNSLNVWANGDISPCCCFHGRALTIGNVKDMSLKEAWNGNALSALRSEILEGRLNKVCRSCLDRDVRHRDELL